MSRIEQVSHRRVLALSMISIRHFAGDLLRRLRFAALVNFLITRSRLSLEMWSMNSTPLRWSISCCSTVASSPFASTSCALPSRSVKLHLHLRGPLDLLVVFRDRQAAFLVGALLLRGPDDLRIDEHLRLLRLVLLGGVDGDDALRHADLNRREADARAPRTSSRTCHRPARARSASTVFTGSETCRSRLSGRMMMSRNAMRGDLSGEVLAVNRPARSRRPVLALPAATSAPVAAMQHLTGASRSPLLAVAGRCRAERRHGGNCEPAFAEASQTGALNPM